MFKRFLAVFTVICFMVPSIVCAEFAPQFKESSKGTADLSKSAPMRGKVYKSRTAMEKTALHKGVSKNQKAMERNTAQGKQTHKMLQGTVNE